MTAPHDWRGRALSIGLGALLILIVAELGLIIFYSQAPPGADLPPLERGENVAPLLLRSLDGEPRRVDYANPATETVLLVFSTGCPACRTIIKAWETLQTGAASEGRRFYYVSTSSPRRTRAFAERYGLTGAILLAEPEELGRLRLSRIPATVAVGPGGRVRGVWIGEVPHEAF